MSQPWSSRQAKIVSKIDDIAQDRYWMMKSLGRKNCEIAIGEKKCPKEVSVKCPRELKLFQK